MSKTSTTNWSGKIKDIRSMSRYTGDDTRESSTHLTVPIPFSNEDQPLLMGHHQHTESSSRHRSNTISSIMSGYEVVKEHLDKKKFLYLVFASLVVYCGFLAAFAPRTSLVRDIRRLHSSRETEAEVYRIYLDALQGQNNAREHVLAYTQRAHSTGDRGALKYTVEQFKKMGFQPKLEKYYPWINQVVHTGVTLYKDENIAFEATMMEDCLEEDPTSCSDERVPGYHAYSASGSVKAQYVFCNYGTDEDYMRLLDVEVDIEDKIHIIRHGKSSQGLQMRNAELFGASGVIIYTDPQDDGLVTEKHGYKAYPAGPARHKSSIERGSVAFLTDFNGDPTTPGYSSKYPTVERLAPAGKVPTVPSVPMSAKEVAPLLRELNGQGVRLGRGGDIDGFDYFTGPSLIGVEVHLQNEQDYKPIEITNVIVEIPGIFQEYDIIIGNHRDSWGVGGAGASSSGSAILLEIARGMSGLLKHGWKPLKPIKLISWDGGTPGMIGSTEHLEDHSQILKRNALAYLNLDETVTGSQFRCRANPLLHDIIQQASRDTNFKDDENWTLYDEWMRISNASIDNFAVQSDYGPFQYHLGIPSASCGFQNNGTGDAVLAFHSNYDTSTWMETQLDPEYRLHHTMAILTGLTALMLSEKELISFKTQPYFAQIQDAYKMWHKQLLDIFPYDRQLHRLAKAVADILITIASQESALFDDQNAHLSRLCLQDFPGWRFYKKILIYIRLLRANSKLKLLDQLFITKCGLQDRPWMKHSLYAPEKRQGHSAAVLPSLEDAVVERDRELAIEWLAILLTQFESVRSLME